MQSDPYDYLDWATGGSSNLPNRRRIKVYDYDKSFSRLGPNVRRGPFSLFLKFDKDLLASISLYYRTTHCIAHLERFLPPISVSGLLHAIRLKNLPASVAFSNRCGVSLNGNSHKGFLVEWLIRPTSLYPT